MAIYLHSNFLTSVTFCFGVGVVQIVLIIARLPYSRQRVYYPKRVDLVHQTIFLCESSLTSQPYFSFLLTEIKNTLVRQTTQD